MCADAQRGLRAVCASHTNALSRLSSFSNHPKLQAIGVGAKLMPEYNKKKERKKNKIKNYTSVRTPHLTHKKCAPLNLVCSEGELFKRIN